MGASENSLGLRLGRTYDLVLLESPVRSHHCPVFNHDLFRSHPVFSETGKEELASLCLLKGGDEKGILMLCCLWFYCFEFIIHQITGPVIRENV
jgi:hypothetical protein